MEMNNDKVVRERQVHVFCVLLYYIDLLDVLNWCHLKMFFRKKGNIKRNLEQSWCKGPRGRQNPEGDATSYIIHSVCLIKINQ